MGAGKAFDLDKDVLTAARERVVNAFSNGVKVYLSLSGGKDSICLANLVHDEIQRGTIDPSLLHVVFIDEEAIFDDVERIVRKWRKKFLMAGAASFSWYCIEVKHFNCFNMLENDESFICWDSTKRDVWVRPMPDFAITDHPMLRRRVDSYQAFIRRICQDGISMAGVRVAESVQRRNAFPQNFDSPGTQLFSPIYDWREPDIWRYIRDEGLDFPDTYLHMYQIGRNRQEMRLSQFFSIDTAKTLVRLNEHEPGLMERVNRREPNAYLASLYWDTEMFRTSGGDRQGVQKGEDGSTPEGYWRSKVHEAMRDGRVLQRSDGPGLVRKVRRFILRYGPLVDESMFRYLHGMLIGGDPKDRHLRAINIYMAQKMRNERMKA